MVKIQEQQLRIADPCAALRCASRAVTHLYDLVLAPLGLKATQFVILHAIYSRGEVAQWRLADEYGLGDDTLSRRLAVLRKRQLITVRTGAQHNGERLYQLTPSGLIKYQECIGCWKRAQERLHLMLGDQEWALLLNILARVTDQARRAETARVANTNPVLEKASIVSAAQASSQPPQPPLE